MDITSQIDVPVVIAAGAAGQCAAVRVESAAAVMASVVLDQCAVLSAGQPRAEAAGVVADGLRAALMDAGIRTAAGEAVSAGAGAGVLGRRGRDRLAARIGDAVTPGGPVTDRVLVEAAVLA
ncbi:hypothetical protein, partial [Streptomyces sp. NRRL B-24484]|uniref:hypothetical protein n=1 Tax=Streptomyces sp. NRRL B-24484 TaxID=1463833 RepID=UPI0005B97649